ncbi:MAG: hypothetical protein ABI675_28950 [Chitinophagaceae bacterium]
MNYLLSKKSLSRLVVLTAIAVVIVMTALSFQLLYQGFQLIDSVLRVSSRDAGQYLSAIANTH